MSQINMLQKRIMRRVYYAFAVRVITHPKIVSSIILLASLYALTVAIHVSSIIENLRRVQVGRLDDYAINTLLHTEFLTLAIIGVVFFSAISLRLSLKPRQWTGMQTT